MRRDDRKIAIAIEKSVIDHPRDRQRCIEREADRRRQLKARHVHLGDARRRRRMHEHRQPARVDRRPNGSECRIRERSTVDVGEHHDAARASIARTTELSQRKIRILPGKRCEPAQPIRMRSLRRRHVIVHDPCGLEADFRAAPVAIRARERDDADVDAMRVHRLQPQVVVEHRRHRRHERGAVQVNRAQSAADLLHRVARAAVFLQQREPRLGQAVRMNIDNGNRHANLSNPIA